MEYNFSDNVKALKPSAIREILKLSSTPGMIPFSAGNPAPEAFPFKEIEKISKDILENEAISALQYSVTEGYAPLKEKIKEMLTEKENISFEGNDIMITSGLLSIIASRTGRSDLLEEVISYFTSQSK